VKFESYVCAKFAQATQVLLTSTRTVSRHNELPRSADLAQTRVGLEFRDRANSWTTSRTCPVSTPSVISLHDHATLNPWLYAIIAMRCVIWSSVNQHVVTANFVSPERLITFADAVRVARIFREICHETRSAAIVLLDTLHRRVYAYLCTCRSNH